MLRNDKDSELFLGIIKTVGTEIDSVISTIRDQLAFFHYTLEEISVSKDIIAEFEKNPQDSWESESDRVNHYMNLGNKIRTVSGDNSILMKGVARYVSLKRDKDSSGLPQPRKRVAYLINSIKHPEEVAFLRDLYGDGFHLIGITSSKERRIQYLTTRKGLSDEEAESLLTRDANEDLKHGQHTQDAFQHADYFISVTNSSDETYNSVARLVDLIFGSPFVTPTFDEYAMFMAYASSLRSADLSRQVGAVIAKNNEILSSGANDCPKVGGGLYWPERNATGKVEDAENGRDYTLGYDSNKIEQQKIIRSILSEFGLAYSEENIKKVKSTGIGDITEYGRVVHGEMEALLSCSRNNISCRNATLYVTTFPCHNCAKHIIAAGIKRVVYIEPYPKSKAFDFYKSEISDSVRDERKVIFEPFAGVGPQRFTDLFAMSSVKWYSRKRKDSNGYKLSWERESAELRTPIALFNYLDGEQMALMTFEDETVALKGASDLE